MTADVVTFITCPTRDGGTEYRLILVGCYDFPTDFWGDGTKNDERIMALGYEHLGIFQNEAVAERAIGVFQNKTDAERATKQHLNIDEAAMGPDRITLKFPWPTKDEVRAAEARWEADGPRRDAEYDFSTQKQMVELVARDLEDMDEKLRGYEATLKAPVDPDWPDLHNELREQLIPKTKAEAARLHRDLENEKITLTKYRADLTALS